jgi:hypothetical protein
VEAAWSLSSSAEINSLGNAYEAAARCGRSAGASLASYRFPLSIRYGELVARCVRGRPASILSTTTTASTISKSRFSNSF